MLVIQARCQGYVTMDDPEHIEARRERIDHLRRWERTRSYTYGERTSAMAALGAASPNESPIEAKRPVPVRPASTSGAGFIKATSVTLGRRGGTAAAAKLELATLEEHDDTSLTDADSSIGGLGDSPCPAVTKRKSPNPFGTIKPALKRPGRGPLDRAATFGPLSFATGR